MYFAENAPTLTSLVPKLHKLEDTTASLEVYLGGWAASAPQGAGTVGKLPRRLVMTALSVRESEALTYTYFSRFVEPVPSAGPVENVIRRVISLGYTQHYLSFADGDIPTGIDGLAYFDANLARDFPFIDLPVLEATLRLVGLEVTGDPGERAPSDDWHRFLGLRGTGAHARLTQEFRVLIGGLALAVGEATPGISQFGLRSQVVSMIQRLADGVQMRAGGIEERLAQAIILMESFGARLQRNPRLAHAMEISARNRWEAQVDVLIVTATLVETRAVISAIEAVSSRSTRVYHVGIKSCWDLGSIAGANVHLVQTEMGSGGSSGSLLTVSEMIGYLHPGSVLVAGIAFGVPGVNRRIGDIVVSRQMVSYELQRVGGSSLKRKVVMRGDRASCSPRLLDRARTAAVTWQGANLHFGLMLSGEKLIDNSSFRDELVSLCGGEVVGGEMEGAGAYAAAHRLKTDWIVIKAISDWADGAKGVRKNRLQERAASHVAGFLAHLLQLGGMAG
ncbi:hypothetical protein Ahu01nite_083820 [Winogradskya humida]|uniref:Nucleoside phosphorylase domain-containing protein n=1 Tax=Winogradskya humida TaxID=113566 RepID=A0ABQ4A355_9ACTN|nr:hypothetical protein Ahu01nite_083820 [Actinoplanes humidus]